MTERINTNFITDKGQMLEIQFHTQESYMTKDLSHVLYEAYRSPGTSDASKAELLQELVKSANRVKIPSDSHLVKNR